LQHDAEVAVTIRLERRTLETPADEAKRFLVVPAFVREDARAVKPGRIVRLEVEHRAAHLVGIVEASLLHPLDGKRHRLVDGDLDAFSRLVHAPIPRPRPLDALPITRA